MTKHMLARKRGCYWRRFTYILLTSSTWLASALTNANHGRPGLSKDSHALQDALKNDIIIRATRKKGLGAFAGRTFERGELVGEYTGEILTRTEVEARYWNAKRCKPVDRRWKKSRKQRRQGLSGDYLFDMGDDLFLDAEDADVSSWCRFMNHAPEVGSREEDNPNCNIESKSERLRLCTEDDNDEAIQPRLWFVARREIQYGEELLYDYGDSYWDGQ